MRTNLLFLKNAFFISLICNSFVSFCSTTPKAVLFDFEKERIKKLLDDVKKKEIQSKIEFLLCTQNIPTNNYFFIPKNLNTKVLPSPFFSLASNPWELSHDDRIYLISNRKRF